MCTENSCNALFGSKNSRTSHVNRMHEKVVKNEPSTSKSAEKNLAVVKKNPSRDSQYNSDDSDVEIVPIEEENVPANEKKINVRRTEKYECLNCHLEFDSNVNLWRHLSETREKF
jgi:hypothetical protein